NYRVAGLNRNLLPECRGTQFRCKGHHSSCGHHVTSWSRQVVFKIEPNLIRFRYIRSHCNSAQVRSSRLLARGDSLVSFTSDNEAIRRLGRNETHWIKNRVTN